MNHHHLHHHHHHHHHLRPSKLEQDFFHLPPQEPQSPPSFLPHNSAAEPFNFPSFLLRTPSSSGSSPTSSSDTNTNNPIPQFTSNGSISETPIPNPNPNPNSQTHKLENNHSNIKNLHCSEPHFSPTSESHKLSINSYKNHKNLDYLQSHISPSSESHKLCTDNCKNYKNWDCLQPNFSSSSESHKLENSCKNQKNWNCPQSYISPEEHISSQFYTFNRESHGLMIRCIREGRIATPDEIRGATPPGVLVSWRAVWKDRNEDTAYLTAWKRIQEKLSSYVNEENGNEFLCFKNNLNQCVSYVDQWQEIVMNYHADGDLKHLGLKETIDRIKQLWTVGAKFYGIPESYIRTCVSACAVCCDESSGAAPRGKRRRFEYTDTIELPAKEVPSRLQQLAAKHKVVLCIRQKYIRYKPFMAEVKDYACHRAGDPASTKKSKLLKREPYASKRCGCGFRIRAIVPISNYNEKEKTFVYEEEGVAVFKLYAVHSGHEPGPLDGNARIMHRVVGHKGGFMIDQDTIYGVGEDAENDAFGFLRKDDGDLQHAVLQKVQELRNEVGMLEGRIAKIPLELLGSVSRELSDIANKLRNVSEYGSNAVGLLSDKQDSDGILVRESDLADWTDHHQRIYGNGNEAELLEEDEDSFERTLGEVARWGEQLQANCEVDKDLLVESCKPEKWLKCNDFDDKSILDCGHSKLTKTLGHDETLDGDLGLGGIQVDTFYPVNPKWFDSPCGLDTGTECSDGEFRHGEIV